jgi:hypothetical protein
LYQEHKEKNFGRKINTPHTKTENTLFAPSVYFYVFQITQKTQTF